MNLMTHLMTTTTHTTLRWVCGNRVFFTSIINRSRFLFPDSRLATRELRGQAAFHVSEERGSQRVGDGDWMPCWAGVLRRMVTDVHLCFGSVWNLLCALFLLSFLLSATAVETFVKLSHSSSCVWSTRLWRSGWFVARQLHCARL